MATDWTPQNVGKTVKRLREAHGWKVVNLADRTKDIGAPIHRVALKKLEDGDRDYVTITELIGLAAALGVPPISLLIPNSAETIEVLPGKNMMGLDALGWFIGAGGYLGGLFDFFLAPEGVETDDSMRIPLRLLQLNVELAQAGDSLRKAEFVRDTDKESSATLKPEIERYTQVIARMESERERLIDQYRRTHGDDQ